MKVWTVVCVIALVLFVSGSQQDYLVPPTSYSPPPYPRWAHSHWIWLASNQANQSAEEALADGYLARSIPVGAVNIDSDWATAYNTFNETRIKYPDFKGMVRTFKTKGIRTIAWVTSVMNVDSPLYKYGKDRNYYLKGLTGDTIKWWHGVGSLLDYTNPEAVDWWHGLMDHMIKEIGLDGWKCDGTDPYVYELGIARGKKGIVTEDEYRKLYYSDFYFYTRTHNPDALIMSRAIDSYGPLFLRFSPRNVCFACWMGDQDPTFLGLQNALRNMMHSAWDGYVNLGSDIGGYRIAGPPPFGRTKELFIRWAQYGAFCSLMENGGDNEHRPWMFDHTNETLDIYRYFAHAHTELIPYLYSTGGEAFEKGKSAITPVSSPQYYNPTSWNYFLGDSLFVAPIVDANTTSLSIPLPSGHNYVDWYDNSKVYEGGKTIDYPTPLSIFPVFHIQGKILPLSVTSSYVNHGDKRQAHALTLLIPQLVAHANLSLRDEGKGRFFSYHTQDQQVTFVGSAHKQPVILSFTGIPWDESLLAVTEGSDMLPLRTSLDTFHTHPSGFHYDPKTLSLWVKPLHHQKGFSLLILGAPSRP